MNVTIKHDNTKTTDGVKNSGQRADVPVAEAISLIKGGNATPEPPASRGSLPFATADRMIRGARYR